jgi:hypothetical protein
MNVSHFIEQVEHVEWPFREVVPDVQFELSRDVGLAFDVSEPWEHENENEVAGSITTR